MMGPSPGVFRAVSRDFVVFIVVVCLFVCFFGHPTGMWDLSSPGGGRTCSPWVGSMGILKHQGSPY